MKRYLVSNVADRQHKKIYKEIGDGAFFDLSSSQHGWEDFASITAGDIVYVINKNLKILLGYEVTKVVDGLVLEDESGWADKVLATSGGNVRVVFGTPCERVDMEYPTFVRKNNIKCSKLNPETHQMYQGFNCTVF